MSDSCREQLVETLQRIADLVPETFVAWKVDEVRRLAVERLWITAGNLAEGLPRLTAQVQEQR